MTIGIEPDKVFSLYEHGWNPLAQETFDGGTTGLPG